MVDYTQVSPQGGETAKQCATVGTYPGRGFTRQACSFGSKGLPDLQDECTLSGVIFDGVTQHYVIAVERVSMLRDTLGCQVVEVQQQLQRIQEAVFVQELCMCGMSQVCRFTKDSAKLLEACHIKLLKRKLGKTNSD